MNPRSEDHRGGYAAENRKPNMSKDNLSVGTFTYSMLSAFAHPSEVKAFKNTKYTFKACVQNQHVCVPSPSAELHIPGIPIPIVNALTKESLRAIAACLGVKFTIRTPISKMRQEIIAKVPYGKGWNLIFCHKSVKTVNAHKEKPVAPLPFKLPPNNLSPGNVSDVSVPHFPPLPASKDEFEKVVNGWVSDIKKDMIEEAGCQVCGLLTRRSDLTDVNDIHVKLNYDILDVSHYLGDEMVTRKERKCDEDPVEPLPGPVLDRSCEAICGLCISSLKRN